MGASQGTLSLGRRGLLLVALAATFFAWSCRASRTVPDDAALGPLHLVVLHTNDIHGQLLPRPSTRAGTKDAPAGGLAKLAAAVDRIRAENQALGARTLLVDAGDWYAGTPEGGLESGRAFVDLLAQLDYDMLCPGNHEFDHGLDNFRALLGRFDGRAAVANLSPAGASQRVEWVEPWRVVDVGGLNIALIGLLTPSTPSITHADARKLAFATPAEALRKARAELAGRADWILPVGHIGVDEAVILAQAHPDLDLIVSGHSHTFLREPVQVGKVSVVQAGARAQTLGRVDVWFDRRAKRVERLEARLIELDGEEPASARSRRIEEAARALVARSAAEMDVQVGVLAAPLTRGRGIESTVAGNWVADLLRQATQADVGVHNRGGTRTDLDAGAVTRRDLFELLPFDNWVVTQDLTGEELHELVRQAVEGKAHSGLDFSGLVVFVSRDGERVRLERVEVAGRALEPGRMVRVATNSFLAGGGDGYQVFAARRGRVEDPRLLRQLAEQEFARRSRVTPPEEARIVSVPAASP